MSYENVQDVVLNVSGIMDAKLYDELTDDQKTVLEYFSRSEILPEIILRHSDYTRYSSKDIDILEQKIPKYETTKSTNSGLKLVEKHNPVGMLKIFTIQVDNQEIKCSTLTRSETTLFNFLADYDEKKYLYNDAAIKLYKASEKTVNFLTNLSEMTRLKSLPDYQLQIWTEYFASAESFILMSMLFKPDKLKKIINYTLTNKPNLLTSMDAYSNLEKDFKQNVKQMLSRNHQIESDNEILIMDISRIIDTYYDNLQLVDRLRLPHRLNHKLGEKKVVKKLKI